jgi:peptide/nickel transport system permease protein
MSEIVVPVGEGLDLSTRTRRERPPLLILFCMLVMLGVVVLAAFGSLIAPREAMEQNLTVGLIPPDSTFWFGTDVLGRDVFSRVIVGARAAVLGPLVVAFLSFALGNILGLIAGFFGGRVDSLIMRWVDLMFALPGLLVAVVVIGAVGGGYWMAVLVLALLFVPFDTRVIRGATLEQMPRPYVEAAKTLGVPGRRIMFLHVWPNVSATAFANTFLLFALSLVSLSGLSFLGFGASPGDPDWGLMLAENRTLLFINPAATLAPGGMIVVVATCMNLIGDWVYERLAARGVTR